MKKTLIFLFSVITMLLLVTGCSVNSTTGRISFINQTDKDMTVKIGTTSTFVSKGAVYDYYFTADIKGKISAEGCEDVKGTDYSTTPPKEIEEATFKIGYAYEVSIYKANDKYIVWAYSGSKAGADSTDSDSNHNIWTNETN